MRYRKQGRYLYSRNKSPITWTTKEPPKGVNVFCVCWHNAQHTWLYNTMYVQA